MSTGTRTVSATYTTADVGKVVDQFTADFHMLAQATGCATESLAEDVGHDVKLMARRGTCVELTSCCTTPLAM